MTKNCLLAALTIQNKWHTKPAITLPKTACFQFYYLLFFLFTYLSICPLAWSETTLTPHELSYEAKVKGINLKVKHILKQTNDHYELTQNSSASLSSINEKSIFSIGENGKLLSKQYSYHRKILGYNHKFQLDFLPKKKIVTHTIKGKITNKTYITNFAYDPLNYQLQLRQDLLKTLENNREYTYPVAEEERLKELKFKSAGSEILQTAVGAIDTLKVERIRNSKSDKKTTFWLAKDWDYILIKIQHQKGGKDNYALNITGGLVGGKKLQGLKKNEETASTQ